MKPIKLTEAAILFPNHQSTLQKTDPEFIELFDNWAFDEVIRHSRLDTKTRVMMILACTVASQALGEYKVMVKRGPERRRHAGRHQRNPLPVRSLRRHREGFRFPSCHERTVPGKGNRLAP
jgi:hypothetical protein